MLLHPGLGVPDASCRRKIVGKHSSPMQWQLRLCPCFPAPYMLMLSCSSLHSAQLYAQRGRLSIPVWIWSNIWICVCHHPQGSPGVPACRVSRASMSTANCMRLSSATAADSSAAARHASARAPAASACCRASAVLRFSNASAACAWVCTSSGQLVRDDLLRH